MASPSPADPTAGRSADTGARTSPSAWQRVRRAVADAFSLWRRSIRTRVVVTTVVLGALVAGSVGWLLVQQIADGLVQSKVNAARAEAISQTTSARELLGSAGSSDFDPATQVRQLGESLVARGKLRGYAVVMMGPIGSEAGGSPATGIRTTPGISAATVPAALQRAVARKSAGTSWTFTRLRRLSDEPGSGTPAVVVGSRIVLPSDGGTYAVYYVFPMNEEQRTLNLVRRSLLTSGVLLLLLTAGIVLLVTWQVIEPVRL
ncbi:MAG: hypothetical protein ACJ72A_14365, partial [Nocardioidaceae bacterium]